MGYHIYIKTHLIDSEAARAGQNERGHSARARRPRRRSPSPPPSAAPPSLRLPLPRRARWATSTRSPRPSSTTTTTPSTPTARASRRSTRTRACSPSRASSSRCGRARCGATARRGSAWTDPARGSYRGRLRAHPGRSRCCAHGRPRAPILPASASRRPRAALTVLRAPCPASLSRTRTHPNAPTHRRARAGRHLHRGEAPEPRFRRVQAHRYHPRCAAGHDGPDDEHHRFRLGHHRATKRGEASQVLAGAPASPARPVCACARTSAFRCPLGCLRADAARSSADRGGVVPPAHRLLCQRVVEDGGANVPAPAWVHADALPRART